MAWEIAKADHIGGREEQQDRVEALRSKDGGVCLAILADGMGGHSGGELAAEAVVETARRLWQAETLPLSDPPAFLERVCKAAHARINEIAAETGLSPRSTCVMLYGSGDEIAWVSVGDSRLYRFRDGKLQERTRDQSVVQMLLDMGKITEDEMATHPDQNRLLQSLGGDKEPVLQMGTAAVEPEDGFLLCSDGLWETIEPEEMAKGLAASSLTTAAGILANRAAQRGGAEGDNIALALGRLRPVRPMSRWAMLLVLSLVAFAIAAFASLYVFPPEPGTAPATVPVDRGLPLTPQNPAGADAPATPKGED